MRRSSVYVFALGLVILSSGAIGCSRIFHSSRASSQQSSTTEQTATQVENQAADKSEEGELTKDPPVTVDIAQSYVREGILVVKLYLTPKTELEAKNVVVSVSGLKDGNVVQEKFQSLKDVIPNAERLREGERVQVVFEIPASEMNEYQVRASWGGDAKEYLAQKGVAPSADSSQELATLKKPTQNLETAALKDTQTKAASKTEANNNSLAEKEAQSDSTKPTNVRLSRSSIESSSMPCDEKRGSQQNSQPCDVRYVVSTSVENTGDGKASAIELALSLIWKEDGQALIAPKAGEPLTANEELISLGSLELHPHESKRIRIAVDRAVPIVPGGAFVPHLRVIKPTL